LQDHEEGQHEDGDQGHHGAEDRPEDPEGGLGDPVGALLEPALVAFQVLVEVVALDQAADRASTGAGVLDIAGQPVDELRSLGGQGADEHGDDAGQGDQEQQEDQERGQGAARVQPVLGQVDHRAQDH
jgi:hypothetical protein